MTAADATVEVPVADDPSIGLELPTISDDYMRSWLAHVQGYTLVILRKTHRYRPSATDPIVREHGRRNMALERSGLLAIVCPARDDSDLAGICIFAVSPHRAAEILSEDPGVKAGIFSFGVHSVVGFPGSCLPADSDVNTSA